eukprot:6459505-Pyramimonas_sp.AAC.1
MCVATALRIEVTHHASHCHAVLSHLQIRMPFWLCPTYSFEVLCASRAQLARVYIRSRCGRAEVSPSKPPNQISNNPAAKVKPNASRTVISEACLQSL